MIRRLVFLTSIFILLLAYLLSLIDTKSYKPSKIKLDNLITTKDQKEITKPKNTCSDLIKTDISITCEMDSYITIHGTANLGNDQVLGFTIFPHPACENLPDQKLLSNCSPESLIKYFGKSFLGADLPSSYPGTINTSEQISYEDINSITQRKNQYGIKYFEVIYNKYRYKGGLLINKTKSDELHYFVDITTNPSDVKLIHIVKRQTGNTKTNIDLFINSIH